MGREVSAAYDSLGRKTNDTGSGYATSYGYDAGGQLTSDVRTGTGAYSISYTYDNSGNRATKVLGGTTESYSYDDANKLTAAGGKTYSYDSAGNTTGVSWSGGSISLSWDAESRLKSETTGGTTVDYAFNGLGQRVAKSNGVSASYILADDGIDSQVLADGSASYAHGASGLISENRGGTSKFYHTDALGSVRALTNTSGTVTDSASRDAFGLVVTSSGSTPTPFGFAGSHGYQQDSETGLMRLGHRMYDASTGRFISRDPIQDGYNWYAYCGNDPVQRIDPTGTIGIFLLVLAALALVDIVAGPADPKPYPGYRPPPGPGQLVGGFIPGAGGAVVDVIGIINSPPQSLEEIGESLPIRGGGRIGGGPAKRLPIGPRYKYPTKKRAYEAAKRASEPGYEPVLDPPNKGLPPHYHPGGSARGRKLGHEHDHYYFPPKQF